VLLCREGRDGEKSRLLSRNTALLLSAEHVVNVGVSGLGLVGGV